MALRQTSLMAYGQVYDHLPKMYGIICKTLVGHTPMTSLEIDDLAKRCGYKVESDKRMAEMVRQDLVEECGTRECKISGRQALTYRVTGRPRKPDPGPAQKTLRQQLDEALARIEELEAEVSRLRSQGPRQTSLLA